jgi:hypothetical protein
MGRCWGYVAYAGEYGVDVLPVPETMASALVAWDATVVMSNVLLAIQDKLGRPDSGLSAPSLGRSSPPTRRHMATTGWRARPG